MDTLPRGWLVVLYAAPWLPYVGLPVLVLGTSAAYYRLLVAGRPKTARVLNAHAWIALGVFVAFVAIRAWA